MLANECIDFQEKVSRTHERRDEGTEKVHVPDWELVDAHLLIHESNPCCTPLYFEGFFQATWSCQQALCDSNSRLYTCFYRLVVAPDRKQVRSNPCVWIHRLEHILPVEALLPTFRSIQREDDLESHPIAEAMICLYPAHVNLHSFVPRICFFQNCQDHLRQAFQERFERT